VPHAGVQSPVNPFTWFTFTGNQSETYTVLTNAAYTYTQTQDYADPVILTADDPRFGGHTKLKITYNDHVWAPNGFIQTEINPVSGATISALTNEMVTFANGGVSDYRFQGYWGADPGSQPSLRVDSFAQTNAWFYDNTTTGFLSMSRRVGCPPFRVSQRPGTLGGVDGVKHDLVEVLDLDDDGDLDVLTCEEVKNLGVFWYENPRQ
jgi:hypothetical protein